MIPATEVDRISSSLLIWHRYDPQVKADLFATGLKTVTGTLLIDPFAVNPGTLAGMIGPAEVSGVVVSNSNHGRDCASFVEEFSVPLYAHPAAQPTLNAPTVKDVADGTKLSDEVTVVSIEGAAPGEIALHSASDGGTVILGDALINFGAHGFTFLPAKYCSNANVMRKSLRKLLDHQFERILFAHGVPILTRGRNRLEALLAHGN